MSRRRLLRRALVVTTVVLVVGAFAGAPLGATSSMEPATDEYCAQLVGLQDASRTVNAATSGPETFATIRRLAKAFRTTSADAPEAIADEMDVLASSISELELALRPLRKSIRPARTQAAYDRMLERIRAAITAWAADQDAEAVSAAQTAVDDWAATACGFRLSGGDDGGR